jgi:hypothetical protein
LTHYVAQAGLELIILLLKPPEGWDTTYTTIPSLHSFKNEFTFLGREGRGKVGQQVLVTVKQEK